MRETSLNFDASMSRGERPILIVYFINGYGARVYSSEYPPTIADLAGDDKFLDGTWKLDGSIILGDGVGAIHDRAGRLIEISSLEEGSLDDTVQSGFERSDPARITVSLSNDDLGLSLIESEENILSAVLRLTMIQSGATDWVDKFEFGEYRVMEYELSRDRLTLQCEEV